MTDKAPRGLHGRVGVLVTAFLVVGALTLGLTGNRGWLAVAVGWLVVLVLRIKSLRRSAQHTG